MQGVSAEVKTLMIFGHNPILTDLTNYLSGSDIYNIPTCGIAEMEFDVSSWGKIGKKSANLISFDYPKKSQTSFGWWDSEIKYVWNILAGYSNFILIHSFRFDFCFGKNVSNHFSDSCLNSFIFVSE